MEMKNLTTNAQVKASGTAPVTALGARQVFKAVLLLGLYMSLGKVTAQPVKVLFSNWGLPAGTEVQSTDSLSVPGWGVLYLQPAQAPMAKLVNHTGTEVRLAVSAATPLGKTGAPVFQELPKMTTELAGKTWAAARPRIALAYPAKTMDTKAPSGFMVILRQHHRLGSEEARKRGLINKDSLILDAAAFKVPLHHLPIAVGVSHYSGANDLYAPQGQFLWYSADSLSRKVAQVLAAGIPKTQAPWILHDLAPTLNKVDAARVLRAAQAQPSPRN